MKKQKPQLIVALDVDSAAAAKKLIDDLSSVIDIFKVGSQLFTATGPEIVWHLHNVGKKVFLDLKFHDIPNTVANAVSAAMNLSLHDQVIFMYTLHTLGNKQMLEAAVKAGMKKAEELKVRKPLAIGVTVLTSTAKEANTNSIVLERARLAKEAGLDGVVASVEEAALIRQELGPEFIIVTPGIRSAGAEKGDQKRVATPQEAIRAGSDFLVVGRPIVEAVSPYEAAQKILKEIEEAYSQ